MRIHRSRWIPALVLALGVLAASGEASAKDPILQPDRLLILSTTDVKGKTGPCGCHIPKGGLARRASYADSLRLTYGQVLLLDAGGFMPEENDRQPAAGFMMSVMQAIGTDAANVGERDLRFGRSFLVQRAAASGLTLVSANLNDKATGKPLFAPYVLKTVGDVPVGIFGLVKAEGDLGPSKDSLQVADPQAVAKTTVAELRQKGARVIILLSQLGKIDSEDLVATVSGIDAVVMGRNVALIEKGRMIKNTIACYGGDQGHYVCRTELTLDGQHRMKSADSDAVIMGPEVPDKPAIDESVRAFEATLTAPKVDPAAAGQAPPADNAGKADGSK